LRDLSTKRARAASGATRMAEGYSFLYWAVMEGYFLEGKS